MKARYLFCFLIISFFTCFFQTIINAGEFDGDDVKATNVAKMNSDGSITYIAEDTTATSSVRFVTYGFSVEPCMTYGTPNYKTNGKFWLKDGQKKEKVEGDTTIVEYKFSAEQVENVFKKSGINSNSIKKSGGYVYLNSIFKVAYYNNAGKIYKTSGFKYTLSSIKAAANWKNPNDFDDHFDIQLKFEPQNVPVYVTRYILVNGKIQKYDSQKVATASPFSVFATSASMAGSLINSNGTKYYLYRSSWSDYDNPVKTLTIGECRKQYDIVYDNYHPIIDASSYNTRLSAVRNRTYEVPMGGIEITFWYRHRGEPKASESKQKDLDEPNTYAVINAMKRGEEQFDSVEGIPTSEQQYVNVFANQYLVSYTFQEYSGTKAYIQKKDYIDTDNSGEKIIKTEEETVYRSYSYWKIKNLKVYALSSATVRNYSLPGESVTIPVSNTYDAPNLSYVRYDNNMREPDSAGSYDVGQILVRNDFLVFNGVVIMEPGYVEENTTDPSSIKSGAMVDGNALFLANQLIDASKPNGDYESSGFVTYTCVTNLGGNTGGTVNYNIDDINNVTIHTPTICDGAVKGCNQYNQMVFPDQGTPSLVLDRSFSVELSTEGWHSSLKGYQYRDFAKYIAKKEVKFPFDVYLNGNFIAADTWIEHVESHQYYVPTWVDEGYYVVNFRTRAINCDPNHALKCTEEFANTDYQNYVATSTCSVEVSGRVYGLTMYDESNYPLWESVFRKQNSLELNGFNYKVGTCNQNGSSTGRYQRFTFPLVNGSHPLFDNIGVLKTGYVSRFFLTTVGSMFSGMDDSVQIVPVFYFVSADGKETVPVDVYYTETIKGKKKSLIKVGSTADSLNRKSMCIGNTYTSVPKEELTRKAALTGRSLKEIKTDNAEIYSFGNINITDELRTYIGQEYVPNGTVPSGVSETKAYKSVQKWYFEYYLPSEIHVCEKGYDVQSYVTRNGVDYKEDFWKTGGYLKVAFDITTIEDGKYNLSYINAQNAKSGYCNMWNMEGYSYEKKDNNNNTFHLDDGDTLFYYLNNDGPANPNIKNSPNPGSAADDYISGGTH